MTNNSNTLPGYKRAIHKTNRHPRPKIVLDALYGIVTTLGVFVGLDIPEDVRVRAGIQKNG